MSVAFDLPTQMGIDSDSPRAAAKSGGGVAIDTVDDMHVCWTASRSTRVDVDDHQRHGRHAAGDVHRRAEERGCAREKLSGTIQNDILKEYIARGTYIYPPARASAHHRHVPLLRARCRSWNPISISGYHIREAGATAVQELAFTLANAIEYVRARDRRRAARRRLRAAAVVLLRGAQRPVRGGREVPRRAPDLRALMRERSARTSQLSAALSHADGGVTLTAQQPLNNVVRVTIQALAATLGGTQSLHTNGYDEALSLPTREAATLALRTQQLIAYESGLRTPWIRWREASSSSGLTDQLESRALELMKRIEELGGAAKAIESGFLHDEIGRSAYAHQMRVESGETTIVGVNRFADAADRLTCPGRTTADWKRTRSRDSSLVRQGETARDSTTRSRTFAKSRAPIETTPKVVKDRR
jgi:methylmalonyl-CoA mutase N-terminal domain/subunit